MAKLLVVEDDQTIGDALRTSLRAHGHDVRWSEAAAALKPIRLAELHARIRAHLRRNTAATGDEQATPIGDLLVDPDARRVTAAGREVAMRAKEFDLLARLTAEPRTRPGDQPGDADGRRVGRELVRLHKTLDVHVAAVRRKLADGGARRARLAFGR